MTTAPSRRSQPHQIDLPSPQLQHQNIHSRQSQAKGRGFKIFNGQRGPSIVKLKSLSAQHHLAPKANARHQRNSQSTQPTKREIVLPPPPSPSSNLPAQHTTHQTSPPNQSHKETRRERRRKGGRPHVSIHTTQAPGVSCQSQKRSLKVQTASHSPSHYTTKASHDEITTAPVAVPAAGHGTRSPAPTAPPVTGSPEDPRPTRQAESST